MSLPNPHARRCLTFANVQLAAKALAAQAGETPALQDAGWIEGYLAVWGNVDSQGEVMVRGCFARSIQQVVPAGKVPLMVRHFANGGDVLDSIGTITQAREDDYGLWIHADLDAGDVAQQVREQVLAGRVTGLSVGFQTLRAELRDGVVYQTECKLLEGTVTMRPANEKAQITGAKTNSGISGLGARDSGTAVAVQSPIPNLQSPIKNTLGQTNDGRPAGTASAPPAPAPETDKSVRPTLPLSTRAKRDCEVRRARLALLAIDAGQECPAYTEN
jgi:HK97 family phage prohead protease